MPIHLNEWFQPFEEYTDVDFYTNLASATPVSEKLRAGLENLPDFLSAIEREYERTLAEFHQDEFEIGFRQALLTRQGRTLADLPAYLLVDPYTPVVPAFDEDGGDEPYFDRPGCGSVYVVLHTDKISGYDALPNRIPDMSIKMRFQDVTFTGVHDLAVKDSRSIAYYGWLPGTLDATLSEIFVPMDFNELKSLKLKIIPPGDA